MDGAHDLGGRQGFGRVVPEAGEPPFHEPWEGRVHGISMAVTLGPGFRHSIEQMDPVEYLTTSYYEHWLHSMEVRGVRRGIFTREDLKGWEQRLAAGEPVPAHDDPDMAAQVRGYLRESDVARYDAPPPRFGAGDAVRVIRILPAGHTRCPGYLRGAPGTVERVHAAQPLLDTYENEDGRVVPEPWYTVAFAARDLWPETGGHTVLVDLWESHLEEPT
ncbi:MAG: nitrile hydratase subunit beta [Gaiellales bacterium]